MPPISEMGRAARSAAVIRRDLVAGAGRPLEDLNRVFTGPVPPLLGRLAFHSRVQKLRNDVVRTGAYGAARSGHAELRADPVSSEPCCAPPYRCGRSPRAPVGSRAAAAALTASMISSVRVWLAIDQPASRFEHRVNTVAR